MAKLLVLFDGLSDDTAAVAEAIREGARSVRFAEADVMRLPGDTASPGVARLRVYSDAALLTTYDAIVLGASAGGHAAISGVLAGAEALGASGALANRLGSVFPADDPAVTGEAHPLWPLTAPMARYGMILVPPGYAGPDGGQEDRQAAARRLGKRLIDIAGWITHARSHHHH